MKEFLVSGILFLAAQLFFINSACCELREVTFFNPPDAYGTISLQELYGKGGALLVVKTYYYRAKNPRILDRIVLSDASAKVLRTFDCDFFGIIHNPRYMCLDGDCNIIIEKEKPVFVKLFPAAEPAVTTNIYSAGYLVKSVKTIFECSNVLKGTDLTNCRYVW